MIPTISDSQSCTRKETFFAASLVCVVVIVVLIVDIGQLPLLPGKKLEVEIEFKIR